MCVCVCVFIFRGSLTDYVCVCVCVCVFIFRGSLFDIPTCLTLARSTETHNSVKRDLLQFMSN